MKEQKEYMKTQKKKQIKLENLKKEMKGEENMKKDEIREDVKLKVSIDRSYYDSLHKMAKADKLSVSQEIELLIHSGEIRRQEYAEKDKQLDKKLSKFIR